MLLKWFVDKMRGSSPINHLLIFVSLVVFTQSKKLNHKVLLTMHLLCKFRTKRVNIKQIR